MVKGGEVGKLSKAKWWLLGCLIIVVIFLAGSVFAPGGMTNAVNRLANNDIAGKLREPLEPEELKDDRLVEMVVERIGLSKSDYQPAVISVMAGSIKRLLTIYYIVIAFSNRPAWAAKGIATHFGTTTKELLELRD